LLDGECHSKADMIDYIENSKKTDFRPLALLVFVVASAVILRKPAVRAKR